MKVEHVPKVGGSSGAFTQFPHVNCKQALDHSERLATNSCREPCHCLAEKRSRTGQPLPTNVIVLQRGALVSHPRPRGPTKPAGSSQTSSSNGGHRDILTPQTKAHEPQKEHEDE
eukprot:scaffold4277_cov405-Prasinococcus_capsulatus_cf.AAC.4